MLAGSSDGGVAGDKQAKDTPDDPRSNEGDLDDDGEGDDDDDDDDESGGDPNGKVSNSAITHSTPLAPFFNFVSSICPTIPQLTYPLLLVIISTIPPSLLPLENGPSPELQSFFAHLWSPVDARLLSTAVFGAQPSSFQIFFSAAVDVTGYLLGKALKLEDGSAVETARWLVDDQLAARGWVEGVLGMGGKTSRRASVQESEAAAFAEALSRLTALSSDLAASLVSKITKSLLDICLCEGEHDSRKTASILPRATPLLQALRQGILDDPTLRALDQTADKLVSGCITRLRAPPTDQQPLLVTYAETLATLLKASSKTLTVETKGVSMHIRPRSR